MTLILTTLRPAEILITSDGRSTERRDGKVVGVVDDFQKIFPVPDHPVAIYHHGINVLGGTPVSQVVNSFLREQNVGNLSIMALSDALCQYVHAAVRNRLAQETETRSGCGFLVAGFSMLDARPMVVETYWQQPEKQVLTAREQHWDPISLIISGDGQKLLPSRDIKQVVDVSRDRVREYHAELMKQAIEAKVEDNPVGGRVHELLITADKWTWTLPPKEREKGP